VVAIGAELWGNPRQRTNRRKKAPNERLVQRSSYPITAVHPRSSLMVMPGSCRGDSEKKSQKLSQTWPIWPPCTYDGAVCMPDPTPRQCGWGVVHGSSSSYSMPHLAAK
jgi:hypothetical protein